jgi:imidazolonepropionase-like amidohydrolase/Tol biopolymer transport system component
VLVYVSPLSRHLLRVWAATILVMGPSISWAPKLPAQREGLSLKSSRTVRFRVTEGTWMSVDVAPDGRTITFDLLGDLYTIPVTGGTARRLTSGTALSRQPRYSPDGRQLVFVSDRSGRENLWIINRDGSNPRRLSDLRGYDAIGAATSPVWSPDGRSILVCLRIGATRRGLLATDPRQNMWLMAAYDVKTGLMRWVSDTVVGHARSVLGPSFDRQRHALYATLQLDQLSSSSILGHWRIGRIDLGNGRLYPEMGANVGRVGMRPAISPNGRWLVYASSSGSHLGLRLRDLSSGRERWLVCEVLDDPSGQEQSEPRDLVPGYAFTPDSKSVVAAYAGKLHRIDLTTHRAVVIPFVAHIERRLAPLTVRQFTLGDTAVRIKGVLQPALSPDGRRVAFNALDRIWVMDLPQAGQLASPPRRLTSDSIGEFYPAWSPDGCWIAYTTWHDGEGGAIWRARVPIGGADERSKPDRLTTDTALYFHTAVSPDGEHIVAMRLNLPPERLLVFPSMLDASPPVAPRLVSVSSQGGEPRTIRTFRPELIKQVYFGSDPTQVHVGLSSLGLDGSDLHTVLAVMEQDARLNSEAEPQLFDGAVSPDGRRAFVSIGSMLYEVAWPTRGPQRSRSDTLEVERAQERPFDGSEVAARRWGAALKPWVTWSRDGRRAAFAQGHVLYLGEVPSNGWAIFQRVEVPLTITPDIPHGTIAFCGARLITMRGFEIVKRGDLVIKDNRIAGIGPSGQVTIPKDARIIDARGTTILPGYVDIHEHSGRPRGVHPEQSWRSLLELAYGVTAVRDPYSEKDNDDFVFADRERADAFLGPRVFSTGVPYVGPSLPIRTLAAAREAVRRHAEDFETETFKVYYDSDNTDRQARQLLAVAAREAGLNATVHTNGLDHALAAVIDGLTGIEHNPDIKIYDDVATLIARSGVTYTHTYLATLFGSAAYMTRRYGMPLDQPKIRRFVPPSVREIPEAICAGCTGEDSPAYAPLELDNLLPIVSGAARIVARGGRIGIGSHGNIAGIGFHYEMWLHALGGMSNHEILRAATIVGALAIGHGGDFGSLERGKLADLQVLNRNPLIDIRGSTSIRYVMKNGRLYEAEDLTEVWPRQRRLGRSYLWRDNIVSNRAHPQHQGKTN